MVSLVENNEIISFIQLQENLDINNDELFNRYINELHLDLSNRTKNTGIAKSTFLNYMNLPNFISEKIFASLDKDNDGLLSHTEFTEGFYTLYRGSYKETAKFIFDIYDFQKEKSITKLDVKLLLSHIPVVDNSNERFKYQMESQEELILMIKESFGSKKSLNFEEYIKSIEQIKSDIFLQLICYLYNKKPFNSNNIKVYQNIKNSPNKKARTIKREVKQDLEENLIQFNYPSRLSGILPTNNYLSTLSPMKAKKSLINPNNVLSVNNDINKNNNNNNKKKTVVIIDNNNRKVSSTNSKNNSNFTSPKKKSMSHNYNASNSLCYDEEDEIYIIEASKYKKHLLVLVQHDLHIYKTKEKEDLVLMINLYSCLVNENLNSNTNKKDNNNYSSLKITFKDQDLEPKIIYFTKQDIMKKWLLILRKKTNQKNINEHYTLDKVLGEGAFGQVKLGFGKKTKQRHAIKIINKKETSKQNIELITNEIDIMKKCCHPGIVKFYEWLEEEDFIYIIMEFIEGQELFSYLDDNGALSESLIKDIMKQLLDIIKYLHNFGIVHRDLKPDNIMIYFNDNKECKIKLMDFGLSKIIGEQEYLNEGLGTRHFSAPELLKQQNYNKQIDIWSIGVICYILYCENYPFDDDKKEVLYKMIMYKDLSFDEYKVFTKCSEDFKDFISKCLDKDPLKRPKINQVLKHKWLA